jgi:iron only hydrogenase large subunit-like protein
MKALYQIDMDMKSRKSYENESVKALYKEYFIEPNSHKAHEILHTDYTNRKNLNK